MLPNLPLLDQTVFEAIEQSEKTIEDKLDCQLIYFYGEIRIGMLQHLRNFIESLVEHDSRRPTIGICLKTPGGEAETVEKMVEIVRHHFARVYFLVPDQAMSAGTIFCMSGDKIFMDYSSSLGPIDPQVPDREGQYLVPALGYLDKITELVMKSEKGAITPAEMLILEKQDLAMLRLYEQAKELSTALLENWLATHKFREWTCHKTTNPGSHVTDKQKRTRAKEIADVLSNNSHWHSHGRMIGMNRLRDELRLEIDDFGEDKELHHHIRRYNDSLSDYLSRQGIPFFLYNRNFV